MKGVLLISTYFFIALISQAQAQVGIGVNQPHEDAVLELASQSKGFLLPRVSLSSIEAPSPLKNHVAGMIVYNLSVSGIAENYVSPGFYYNTGEKWERLQLGYNNWFYMPTVVFDTGTTLTNQTKDLYALYRSQFDGTNSNFSKSEGAPAIVPHIPEADKLYYYVVDADPKVFSNIKITALGVMTYDVTAAATDQTYINIVFVLK